MNKKKIIKINNKIIDEKSNTYVIAEIGINHLGDKNLCIRQINSAIKCGADAVKLQIADYEDSYSKNTQSYKIFKKYSLNLDNLITGLNQRDDKAINKIKGMFGSLTKFVKYYVKKRKSATIS